MADEEITIPIDDLDPSLEPADPELEEYERLLENSPAGVQTTPESPSPDEPKVPETGKTDEEVEETDELPVDPSADNFRKLREITKESRQAVKDLRAEVDALKDVKVETPTPDPGTASEEPSLTDDEVFIALAKAEASEYDNEDQNHAVALEAAKTIGIMSSQDILNVRDRARRGVYGNYSDEILKSTEPALVEASVREQHSSANAQESDQQLKAYNEKVSTSFAKVLEDHPDIQKPDSPLKKALDTWWRENVAETDGKGTILKRGPLASVLAETDFPEKLMPIFMASYTSNGGTEVSLTPEQQEITRLKAENNKLKRETDDTTVPVNSGGAGEAEPDDDPEMAELERTLGAMPAGTRD